MVSLLVDRLHFLFSRVKDQSKIKQVERKKESALKITSKLNQLSTMILKTPVTQMVYVKMSNQAPDI